MVENISADICVIGGGSAGLSTAAGAAAFGQSVVLIERGKMGGDCLNYGCVPSKALIAAAGQAHAIAQAGAFGIEATATVEFANVKRHIRDVIAAIAPNDSAARFTALGVRVIRGEARFVDRRTVEAGDCRIRARRFVIATGSRPHVPDIPGLDTVRFETNETIFNLDVPPEHLVIVGAGPAGLELAQAYCRLGVAVTVLEAARALSGEDPELSEPVLRRMRLEGVSILEQTALVAVERGETSSLLLCNGPSGPIRLKASHILLATGRAANVEQLDLEKAAIRLSGRGIRVGRGMRTSNRRVYAIGDVAGGLQYTHAASHHAQIILPQILFRLPFREKPHLVPHVTFTDPEIAHVGLRADEAIRTHRGSRILRWPYAENDRAQAERQTTGLIKIVVDRRARILGASIAGAGAGEMIHLWSLAVARKMTLKDMQSYIAPYPTMSEIGKRATMTYYLPLSRLPWLRSVIRFLGRFG